MRNPLIYRARFSGLIMTVFGREQTIAWNPTIEIYQASDSPERWEARPPAATGRFKWVASSPVALAKIIEEAFVTRETEWEIIRPAAPAIRRQQPTNIIEFRPRRQA